MGTLQIQMRGGRVRRLTGMVQESMKKMRGGLEAVGRGHLTSYFLKSGAIVAALFMLSRALLAMPGWMAMLALVGIGLVPAMGSTYRSVVKRTFKQGKFKDGSVYKDTYLLRIPKYMGYYLAGVFAVACMLLESPMWGVWMWAAIALSPLLFMGVAVLARWWVERKERVIPLLREARVARISMIASGVVLCILISAFSFFQPAAFYGCAADAFLAAPNQFGDSPSALLREAGDFSSIALGLSSYALARLHDTSPWWYIMQFFMNLGTAFAITSMLSVCLIEPGELGHVFRVLRAPDGGGRGRILRRFCIVFAALPVIIGAVGVALDAGVGASLQDGTLTPAKRFVRDQAGLVVYELDGKFYNPEAVDELLARAGDESDALFRDAQETLVPLVNASFDARVANVDGYLDWYYGLFTDWEILASTVKGSAEDFARGQLEAKLEKGIDGAELDARIEQYLKRTEDLRTATLSELSKYELTRDFPEWIVKETESLDAALGKSLEPSERLRGAYQRLGIGLATRTAAKVISKKVVGKIATKSAFKAIASRAAGLAATTAASGAGGPAAFAAAAVVTFGVDIVLVKADELMNRDAYRAELVSAIEEQRGETLAALRGSDSGAVS